MKALFSYQELETLIAQGQQASFTESRARKPRASAMRMKARSFFGAGEVGYLEASMQESSMPALWNAGRITGWMEALMENALQTCKSFVLAERITALQAL